MFAAWAARCDRGKAAAAASIVAPAAACLVAGTTPALAIPSPELVVGTLSSLSQVVALVSVVLGGSALAAGSRLRRQRTGPAVGPSALRLAAVLGAIALASLALNAVQYVTAQDARRDRLESTLVRPTPKTADGRSFDPALKEVAYSEQNTHPLGISTEAAARIVAQGAASGITLLDIRETAETEMGSLPGAIKVRFPDLDAHALGLSAATSLVFCHNGNRSAETCIRLKERGIDCRFIIGGLEKWLVEGRSLAGSAARTIDDIRALPPFPNQGVLLETDEVRRLVSAENAQFVDVRYPGEFASGHLPGAINMPLRLTPSAAIERAVRSLLSRPVIAPCYDRRSCFFAEILGLELHRAGGDFRGQYTVPWEYFVPAERPPHVDKWLAEANRSTWARASETLAGWLALAAGVVGLPAAIVLLAMLSRLVVLPVSLKAERDQMTSRAISRDVARLRARLASDPVRLSRAMRSLYRRHGLTPVRNLLAMAFVPLLAMCVEAVIGAAQRVPEGLLWLPSLADYDRLLLLPSLFAGLVALYLNVALATTRCQHALVWLVGVPLLVWAAALLPAAGGLYLAASAALLLLQRLAVTYQGGCVKAVRASMRRRWARLRLAHAGIVPLGELGRLGSAGGKARRLAELAAAGRPVPDGVVLTEAFLADFAAMRPARRRRALRRIWRWLGGKRLAVRSSAEAEDGAAKSFAGVFESVLDIDQAALAGAISTVTASFAAEKAAGYGSSGGAGNVLVQPMVEARYSGVLFTEDPGAPGAMLVELVEGGADKLVSGKAVPQTFRFGRISGAPLQQTTPPCDLGQLMALARAAEAQVGAPQDIEWALGCDGYQILQCRDIMTRVAADDAVRNEWRRLTAIAARSPASEVVLAQNEMAELLPRPTPLSLSLLEALWASGGSIDLAARALRLEYRVDEQAPAYHVTVFGRLYVDKREEQARAPRPGRGDLKRIVDASDRIETSVREEFLPRFLAEVRVLSSMDLARHSIAELVALFERLVHHHVSVTHVEVDIVNIAARVLLDAARSAAAAAGVDPATALASIAPTAMVRALENAAAAPPAERGRLIEEAIGHRSVLDYELSVPRYGELPGGVQEAADAAIEASYACSDRDEAMLARLPAKSLRLVHRARRFQTLKEDAKHHALRELALLRRLVLAIAARFDLGPLVFHLGLDEVVALTPQSRDRLAELARGRQAASAVFGAVSPLPSTLGVAEIETGSIQIASPLPQAGALRGTRVSGAGAIEGRAVVVSQDAAESGASIAGFQPGDIIVTPMVHPRWLPEVVRSGGVVTDIGGWLSHMSIVAREHGIAMIVGVRAAGRIATGQRIRLGPDGQVDVIGALELEPARAAE